MSIAITTKAKAPTKPISVAKSTASPLFIKSYFNPGFAKNG